MIVTEGEFAHRLRQRDLYGARRAPPTPPGCARSTGCFPARRKSSEPLYRLAQAAREGKRGAEELRLTPPLLGEGAFGWYRIRVRPIDRAAGPPAALWTISDVTRERERHENVFQELQHAIDFLDHAPAGFFSTDPNGNISYMNATLADWLDFDLAQVGSGGLALRDIVVGDAAALLDARHGAAQHGAHRADRSRPAPPRRIAPAGAPAASRRLWP